MLSTEKMGSYIKSIAEYTIDPEMRQTPGFRDFATLFWGQQGIGKTSGTKAAANALKIPNINLRLAQYPPEDFGIPRVKELRYQEFVSYFIEYALPKFFPQYETNDKGEYVMRREVRDGDIVVTDKPRINFKLLRNHIANYDFLERYYSNLGLDINDAPGGILLLDEITRIADPNLFQMIFQLPENFGLRDYKVPAGISIFAAANPPSDDYQVGTWFDDAAFANRFVHIGIKPEFSSWRKHAVASNGAVSQRVIEFYSTYPKALFDKVEEFNINDVIKPSPRSSEYLHVFDELIDIPDEEILFNAIQGILGTTFASNYVKFRKEFVAKPVSGEEIVFEYDVYNPDTHDYDEQEALSEPRQKVVEARMASRADYLNEVSDNLVQYLEENVSKKGFQDKMKENILRITRFLFDLPADVTAATVKRLIDEEDDVHEAINDVFTHCKELYTGLKRTNQASKASN